MKVVRTYAQKLFLLNALVEHIFVVFMIILHLVFQLCFINLMVRLLKREQEKG